METCSMLKEWEIQKTNYDGEPRDIMVAPLGCKGTCGRFLDCVSMVRTTYVPDDMTAALKGS